jgi:hypothetical protein
MQAFRFVLRLIAALFILGVVFSFLFEFALFKAA